VSAQVPHIFSKLPEHQRETLKSHLSQHTYSSGEHIFRQDESGEALFFIEEGCVKVTRTSEEGKELLITYLKKGDFFGELSVLTGEMRTADVVAQDRVVVSLMNAEGFKACLSDPEFSRLFMTALAWRLHDSSERLSDLVLYNVYRNVLETLRSLAQEEEHGEGKRLVVKARPTHQEIAALVGSSREVITRTLRHLQLDGRIEVKGKQVVIL
jgi:CRP-like cAMP-binding protein